MGIPICIYESQWEHTYAAKHWDSEKPSTAECDVHSYNPVSCLNVASVNYALKLNVLKLLKLLKLKHCFKTELNTVVEHETLLSKDIRIYEIG